MDLKVLTEGQIFASRYSVERCIASGGMGSVYEVKHIETDRRCALKVMLPHIVSDPGLRERFKREARVTSQITSEFIVDVLDAGVDDATECPFLVMEYLEGNDLSGELEKLGRIPPEDVVTYLWQVSLALNKTHAAKIVHRDLKPENLFLTRRDDGSPRIKILDFGISKVVEASTRGNATQTLGTPLYMPPEQFKGKVYPASDIYALSMIAFTLIVGAPYWNPVAGEDESVYALATRIIEGLPESASSRAARYDMKLPEGFDEWLAKGTATDYNARFASAGEAIAALGELYGIKLKAAPVIRPASLSGPPPEPAEQPAPKVNTSPQPTKVSTDPKPAPAQTKPISSSTGASANTQVTPEKGKSGLVLGVVVGVVAVGVAAFVGTRMAAPTPPAATATAPSATVPVTAPTPVQTAATSADAATAAPPVQSASSPDAAAAPSASVAGKTPPVKTTASSTSTAKTPPTNTTPTATSTYSRY